MVLLLTLTLGITLFILTISLTLLATNAWLYWWIILFCLIPPWGWWGYVVYYVPRERAYRPVEIEGEKPRVRFDLQLDKEFII